MNDAFARHHGALAKLRGSDRWKDSDSTHDAMAAAKTALKQGDKLLKGIRKAAVKAIHESCGAKHDEDDDEDHDGDNDQDKDEAKDEDGDKDEEDAAKVDLVFSGAPAAMAEQAVNAMEIVMDAVRTQLAALPAATPKVLPVKTPKAVLKPVGKPLPKPTKSPHPSHSKGR